MRVISAIVFITVVILLGASYGDCRAASLDKIKVYILNSDYQSAITEGERLISLSGSGYQSEELYYLLGLSYLKVGNYLRASDIFEIILKEFKNSAFREGAYLGLGDTFFLRGDYQKARDNYLKLVSDYPHTKLKAAAYSRLAQSAAKCGNTEEAQSYQVKLESEFSLSPESLRESNILPSGNFYYTVQAGSFANRTNADNLARKLTDQGYSVYVEELPLQDKVMYRVKVGKFNNRQEALELEAKLSREGYPTKVCP